MAVPGAGTGAAPEREGTPWSTSYGILSTYPPTQCGLATFTSALVQSLRSPQGRRRRRRDRRRRRRPRRPPEVRHQWVRGQEDGAEAAAARLNGFDVVIIQHEYGIFGGPDGQDVLDVVRAVTRPVIIVLHTVLATPSPRQKAILDELVLMSDAVVTMTLTAKDRLVRGYRRRPEDKIRVIPHGAAEIRPRRPRSAGRPRAASTADRPDVGAAGRGQGDRVGHLGNGTAAGHPPGPEVPRRRRDPSQGPRTRRGGVSPWTRGPGPRPWRRRCRHLRRALPRDAPSSAASSGRPKSSCCPTTRESR